MERQLRLDLHTAEERVVSLRNYLAPLRLPARAVDVLCLLCAHGTLEVIDEQRASRLAISKQNAARKMGCAPNTFVEGANDLRLLGVLDYVATTRPTTYFVNWERVAKLDPPPDYLPSQLLLFATRLVSDGQRSVSDGQAPRDTVSINTHSKVRVTVNRDTVTRDTCALTEADQALTIADQTRSLPHKPWQNLNSNDLCRAVYSRDVELLLHLYREGVQLGWIPDCEDSQLRFLALCHHCATTTNIRSRFGVLVTRVGRGLQTTQTRQECDDWAASVLRSLRRDPTLSDELEPSGSIAGNDDSSS